MTTSNKLPVTNYQEAVEFLGNKGHRTIAPNTILMKVISGIVVTLHGNTILFYFENGDLWISNHGWNTVTTRNRLNRLLPYSYCVYSKDSTMHIFTPYGDVKDNAVYIDHKEKKNCAAHIYQPWKL